MYWILMSSSDLILAQMKQKVLHKLSEYSYFLIVLHKSTVFMSVNQSMCFVHYIDNQRLLENLFYCSQIQLQAKWCCKFPISVATDVSKLVCVITDSVDSVSYTHLMAASEEAFKGESRFRL